MNPLLRLQRLDALHGLSSRLSGESVGLLGDSLDSLLDATKALTATADTGSHVDLRTTTASAPTTSPLAIRRRRSGGLDTAGNH